jgi:hypothetical protein
MSRTGQPAAGPAQNRDVRRCSRRTTPRTSAGHTPRHHCHAGGNRLTSAESRPFRAALSVRRPAAGARRERRPTKCSVRRLEHRGPGRDHERGPANSGDVSAVAAEPRKGRLLGQHVLDGDGGSYDASELTRSAKVSSISPESSSTASRYGPSGLSAQPQPVLPARVPSCSSDEAGRYLSTRIPRSFRSRQEHR